MDFWASSTNDTRDTLMVNGFVDYYKPPPQRDNNQQPNITRKKRINIRPINLMVGYLKAKQELDREYTTKLQSIAMKMEKTIPLCDESHEGLRECMHGYASLQRTLSENHREKMELADADIQQLEMLRGEIVTTYTEGRAKITQLKEQYSTQKATTLSINK